MNARSFPELAGGALLVLAGGAFFLRLGAPPSQEREIAGYATNLQGRTPGQRHNARLAADALNGRVIAPGAVFSFNRTVRSWSLDQGYVKAPVSYDGELVRAYGGGVCQTSTTLYNAALLAGLPILERHAHVFAPHYVPPGRDAAVAQRNIDLRLRNPYSWPLRIRAAARGDRLEVRIYGTDVPEETVQVSGELLSTLAPLPRTRTVYQTEGGAGRAYIRNPGATGYRVVTYRLFCRNGREARRERLADDTYQAMDRVTQINEETAHP